MAVPFKMVPKRNVLVSPPVVKYYPVAVAAGSVDFDYLCDKVARRSSMSPADCYGAIIALTDVIGEELLQGNIVTLEHLGSFRLTLKGTPADSETDLGKSNITEAKVIYKPSKIMSRVIRGAKFRRLR